MRYPVVDALCGPTTNSTLVWPVMVFNRTLYCVDDCFQSVFIQSPIQFVLLAVFAYIVGVSSGSNKLLLTARAYRQLSNITKARQLFLLIATVSQILPFVFECVHRSSNRYTDFYLVAQCLKISTHLLLLLCFFSPHFLVNLSGRFRYVKWFVIPGIVVSHSQLFTAYFYPAKSSYLDVAHHLVEVLSIDVFFVLLSHKSDAQTNHVPLEASGIHRDVLLDDESCSLVSRLLFCWTGRLLDRAHQSPLVDHEDLFVLPDSLQPEACRTSVNGFFSGQKRAHTKKNALVRYLLSTFWRDLLYLGVVRLVGDGLSFVFPVFLNKILAYLDVREHPDQSASGFYFAGALFAGSLLNTILISYFNFEMSKLTLRARTVLMNILYSKIFFVRSPNLMNSFGTGEVLNLASTDIERIVNFSPSLYQFISLPTQLVVTLVLLYYQVGVVFLSAVGFILAIIPLNRWICNRIAVYSSAMMAAKDLRLKMVTEVLRSIRTVVMCNWTENFGRRIQLVRDREVQFLKYRKYLDALCVYFWATTPVIVSSLVFGTFSYMNGSENLTSSMIFTSLALLGMLIQPLNALPWVLNGLVEASVSARRLEKFLSLPEISSSETQSIQIGNPPYERQLIYKFENCDFGFLDSSTSGQSADARPILRNLNLEIKAGSFIGIIGQVGSGKSTFIKVLLNEVNKLRGEISVCDEVLSRGIAYVSQDPWLQEGSIRENILFGLDFDVRRYVDVLEICNLRPDLMNLSSGDMTLVGNHGTTLSGGQKLRISLARALYQGFDIFLFDEPFAGLDQTIAERIYSICSSHLLFSGKTVILSTQHLQFLRETDHVMCFSRGRIEKIIQFHDIFAESLSRSRKVSKFSVTSDTPKGSGELAASNNGALDQFDTVEAEKEQREFGVVQLGVYKYYLAAVGHWLFVIIVLFVALMQSSKTASDYWLSYWTSSGPHKDAVLFLTVFISIAVANSVFTLVRAFTFALGGVRAAIAVHGRLLDSVLGASMAFFDLTDFGIIINRFSSDVFNTDDALPFTFNIFLAQLGFFVGSIVVIVLGMPWMIVLLGLLAFPYYTIQKYFRSCSRELKRLCAISLSPIYSQLDDTIQGLAIIRAFRHIERFKKNLNSMVAVYNRIQYSNAAVQQWLNLRLQLLGVVVIGAVALVAVALHYTGQDFSNSGVVGLALVYCLSLTGILNGVVQSFTQTELDLISVERIMNTVAQVRDKFSPAPMIDLITNEVIEDLIEPYVSPLWPESYEIAFRNVSARYRRDLPLAIDKVDFLIHSGERIAILGRTGSGKSTLFQILFGLIPAEVGCVTIDGVNINQVKPDRLRNTMFLLSQDPFLFSGTIRENMDPRGEYEDDEIHNALYKCHINLLCDTLGGLDAQLRENGKNLSYGQRQLFCLARALLYRRKIICLDEMTSNIDEATEKELESVLQEAFVGCTILHIAHKYQSVKNYDRFLIMGAGGRFIDIVESSDMKIKFSYYMD